VFDLETEADVT